MNRHIHKNQPELPAVLISVRIALWWLSRTLWIKFGEIRTCTATRVTGKELLFGNRTDFKYSISAIIHNALVCQGAYFSNTATCQVCLTTIKKKNKKQQLCFRKVKSCIIMRFMSTKARINWLKRKKKQTSSELKSMFCKLGSNCAIHGENGGK